MKLLLALYLVTIGYGMSINRKLTNNIYIWEDITGNSYGSRVDDLTGDWYPPKKGACAPCIELYRDEIHITVPCIKPGQRIPPTLERNCTFCGKPLY